MKKILLIYTGGTIGMKTNPATGALAPFDFSQIENEVPELHKFGTTIDTISFSPLIDSSDFNPSLWGKLAQCIYDNYLKYDGFVVLCGTDTMAYTASALSFMLENLTKPVIFTGSQIPMGVLRTDGRDNLISSIEVASEGIVKEVCIFFQNVLFRGNRTTKHNAEQFNAFKSNNYPPLAEAGITIKYNDPFLRKSDTFLPSLTISTELCQEIAVVKIFPGISVKYIREVMRSKTLKAVILETFGSGNAPSSEEFLDALKEGIDRGMILLNVTQCSVGSVNMNLYDTGRNMKEIGVVSGKDITIEAATTKIMYLLGKKIPRESVLTMLSNSIRGEMTE